MEFFPKGLMTNTVTTVGYAFIFLLHQTGSNVIQYGCDIPLGLESGHIGHTQLTASSYAKEGTSGATPRDFHPSNARLNFERSGFRQAAWKPATPANQQYIQLDLLTVHNIVKIATQGGGSSRFVTQYKIGYSADGIKWTDSGKIYDGNFNGNDINIEVISPPIVSRYVRVFPTQYQGAIELRMELYGCILHSECLTPVGENGGCVGPGGALDIDLYGLEHVTSVNVSSKAGKNRVSSFILQYSAGGRQFKDYTINNTVQIFRDDATDADTVTQFQLPLFMRANRVRILSQESDDACLQISFGGCKAGVCPPGFTPHDGECLYSFARNAIYSNALVDCASSDWLDKAYPAILDDGARTEMAAVLSFGLSSTPNQAVLIGLSREHSRSSIWRWPDNTIANWTKWNIGFPTQGVNAGRCSRLRTDSALWEDAQCDVALPYVCTTKVTELEQNGCNPSWIASREKRTRSSPFRTISNVETQSDCVRMCYDSVNISCAAAQFDVRNKECQLFNSSSGQTLVDNENWIHFRFYCPAIRNKQLIAELNPSFSASSSHTDYPPENAILDQEGGGWRPRKEERTSWIQVAFDEPVIVQQITTQGGGKEDEFEPSTYITNFQLLFGDFGPPTASTGALDGNSDAYTYKINFLQEVDSYDTVKGTVFRVEFNHTDAAPNGAALRFELFGFKESRLATTEQTDTSTVRESTTEGMDVSDSTTRKPTGASSENGPSLTPELTNPTRLGSTPTGSSTLLVTTSFVTDPNSTSQKNHITTSTQSTSKSTSSSSTVLSSLSTKLESNSSPVFPITTQAGVHTSEQPNGSSATPIMFSFSPTTSLPSTRDPVSSTSQVTPLSEPSSQSTEPTTVKNSRINISSTSTGVSVSMGENTDKVSTSTSMPPSHRPASDSITPDPTLTTSFTRVSTTTAASGSAINSNEGTKTSPLPHETSLSSGTSSISSLGTSPPVPSSPPASTSSPGQTTSRMLLTTTNSEDRSPIIVDKGCGFALGLESGAIGHTQLSASSYNLERSGSRYLDYHPANARLRFAAVGNRKSSWRPALNDRSDPYIQVDLLTVHNVTKIATQGDGGSNYVAAYTMSYSEDGKTFIPYRKTFFGNYNGEDIAENEVKPPIVSRYIRLYPSTSPGGFIGNIDLRIELYGCNIECPEGSPSDTRFEGCQESGDGFEVNLVRFKHVLEVESRGQPGRPRLGSFFLQYLDSGRSWKNYSIDGNVQEFKENTSDPDVLVKFLLPLQLRSTKLKLLPTTQNGCVDLRIVGCIAEVCPAGFTPHDGECIYPWARYADYSTARAECSSSDWLDNTYPAILDDGTRNEMAASLSYGLRSTGSPGFYIGLSRRSAGDSWKWPDGNQANWTKWDADRPGNDLCTMIQPERTLWQDVSCSNTLPYICTTKAAESQVLPCVPSWISSVGARSRLPVDETIPRVETPSECVRLCYESRQSDCSGAQFNMVQKECQLLNEAASRNLTDDDNWVHYRFYCPAFRNKGLIAALPRTLTASSELPGQPATNALLDSSLGGWRPSSNDQLPWIEVNFNESVIVQQITTQGGGKSTEFDPDTYISKFIFLLSNNGMDWIRIGEFEGNNDAFSYKINFFDTVDEEVLPATSFRVQFDNSNSAPAGAALRFELFGYEESRLATTQQVETSFATDSSTEEIDTSYSTTKRPTLMTTETISSLSPALTDVTSGVSFTVSGADSSISPAITSIGQTTTEEMLTTTAYRSTTVPDIIIARDCNFALGLESGAIGHTQLSASSYNLERSGSRYLDYHPANARLRFAAVGNRKSSWRPALNDRSDPYIQVDLLTVHNVTKIATQGDGGSNYVAVYTMSYSEDGKTFIPYGETFFGNYNGDDVFENEINPSIVSRYIRLYPLTSPGGFMGNIDIRMELYGCSLECPEGSASDTLFEGCQESSAGLEVDMVLFKHVLELESRGQPGRPRLGSFFLQYLDSGRAWRNYTVDGNVQEFKENTSDPNVLVKFQLPLQLRSTKLKFSTTTQDGCVGLRIVGCIAEVCPAGFTPHDGECIYPWSRYADYSTARAECSSSDWLDNTYPAILDDGTRNEMAASLSYGLRSPREPGFYIGLNRASIGDPWMWPDGNQANWTKWDADRPGNDFCTMIQPERTLWQDVSCSNTLPYICTTKAAESQVLHCVPSWISSVGARSRLPVDETIPQVETPSECVRLCYESRQSDCSGAQFNMVQKECQLLNDAASRNLTDDDNWVHYRFYCPAFRNKGLIATLPRNLTASSELPGQPATNALLDSSLGGWRPSSNDPIPWIEVQFDEPVIVQQIISQGGGKPSEFDPDTYVSKFDLLLSNNGMNWTRIGEFEGNFDAFSYKINFIDMDDKEEMPATFFRVQFDRSNSAPSGAALRFELFGYEESVTLTSSPVPDTTIETSATTTWQETTSPGTESGTASSAFTDIMTSSSGDGGTDTTSVPSATTFSTQIPTEATTNPASQGTTMDITTLTNTDSPGSSSGTTYQATDIPITTRTDRTSYQSSIGETTNFYSQSPTASELSTSNPVTHVTTPSVTSDSVPGVTHTSMTSDSNTRVTPDMTRLSSTRVITADITSDSVTEVTNTDMSSERVTEVTISDMTDSTTQVTTPDMTDSITRVTSTDMTDSITRVITSDMTGSITQVTTPDMTDSITQVTTSDMTDSITPVTSTDMTDSITRVTTPDMTDSITQQKTSDMTDSITRVTLTDMTDSITRVITSDMTGSITQVTTPDMTDSITQVTTSDMTDSITQETTSDMTDSITRVTSTDITDSITQVTTPDITDSITQETTLDMTDSITRVTSTDITDSITQVTTPDMTDSITQETTLDMTDSITRMTSIVMTDSITGITTPDMTDSITQETTSDMTDSITRVTSTDITDSITQVTTPDMTDSITQETTLDMTDSITRVTSTDMTDSITGVTTPDMTDSIIQVTTSVLTSEYTTRDTSPDITPDSSTEGTRAGMSSETITRVTTPDMTDSITRVTSSDMTDSTTRLTTLDMTADYGTRGTTQALTSDYSTFVPTPEVSSDPAITVTTPNLTSTTTTLPSTPQETGITGVSVTSSAAPVTSSSSTESTASTSMPSQQLSTVTTIIRETEAPNTTSLTTQTAASTSEQSTKATYTAELSSSKSTSYSVTSTSSANLSSSTSDVSTSSSTSDLSTSTSTTDLASSTSTLGVSSSTSTSDLPTYTTGLATPTSSADLSTSPGEGVTTEAPLPVRCDYALGLESGTIGHTQLSASSYSVDNLAIPQKDYHPSNARLNYGGDYNRHRSWRPESRDDNQPFLQVDLLITHFVSAVSTQGGAGYVTKYRLRYSQNGVVWSDYDQVLPGNNDTDSVHMYVLSPVVEARFVRIYPREYIGSRDLRLELHGCAKECSGNPRDSFINTCVRRNETFEMNFQGLYHLTSIITDGFTGGARVRVYQVQYKTGSAWQTYTLDNVIVNFTDNADGPEETTTNRLAVSVRSQYFRIVPLQPDTDFICIKARVKGCEASGCPAGFTPFYQDCIFPWRRSSNYSSALLDCSSSNWIQQTVVATLDGGLNNQMAADLAHTSINGDRYLHGLRRSNSTSDDWAWASGEPYSWSRWENRFPQRERCAVMQTTHALWEDVSCDNHHPFICTTKANRHQESGCVPSWLTRRNQRSLSQPTLTFDPVESASECIRLCHDAVDFDCLSVQYEATDRECDLFNSTGEHNMELDSNYIFFRYYCADPNNRGILTEYPNVRGASSALIDYPPERAVLDSSGGGWRPRPDDPKPYIEVEFEEMMIVEKVITQGGARMGPARYVEGFQFLVSDNTTDDWTSLGFYQGNDDGNSYRINIIRPPDAETLQIFGEFISEELEQGHDVFPEAFNAVVGSRFRIQFNSTQVSPDGAAMRFQLFGYPESLITTSAPTTTVEPITTTPAMSTTKPADNRPFLDRNPLFLPIFFPLLFVVLVIIFVTVYSVQMRKHKSAMRGSRVSVLRPDAVDGYGEEYAGESGGWSPRGPSKSAISVLRPQSGLRRDIRPEDTNGFGINPEKHGRQDYTFESFSPIRGRDEEDGWGLDGIYSGVGVVSPPLANQQKGVGGGRRQQRETDMFFNPTYEGTPNVPHINGQTNWMRSHSK